jgi:aspartyl/asparaginyl-tRNA synthetase
MKKVIRLTEGDLIKLVKRVINESDDYQRLVRKTKKEGIEKMISRLDYSDIIRILGGKDETDSQLRNYQPYLRGKDYEPILDDEGNMIEIKSIGDLKRYKNI